MSHEDTPGFSIFSKSGFQIRFENGWIASVQFGSTHYCSNRSKNSVTGLVESLEPEMLEHGAEHGCANAEVAAFKGEAYHKWDGELSKGWVTPAELLVLLNEIAAFPA